MQQIPFFVVGDLFLISRMLRGAASRFQAHSSACRIVAEDVRKSSTDSSSISMNSTGHLRVDETATKRADNGKAPSRKKGGRRRRTASAKRNGAPQPRSVGTIARTKALFSAAVRVWELNHRTD